jgi:Ala-tRNA(Pro) deacylase
MTLNQGRPDCTGRLPKEIRCYDLLDNLGIDYITVDHEAAMTMEACIAVDEALGAAMCKNLLLCNRQQTDFYLLMLPGEKVFKTSVLSKAIGSSRLSFAGGEHMERLLDITPGSLTVLGLMNDRENAVRLLIDRELLEETHIGVHPCVNTSSLKLRLRDLLEKFLPAVDHGYTAVEL